MDMLYNGYTLVESPVLIDYICWAYNVDSIG
jgi:hypothetical protein